MEQSEMEKRQLSAKKVFRMRMLDMHAHPASFSVEQTAFEERRVRRDGGIVTCFSCGTPEEWESLNRMEEKLRRDAKEKSGRLAENEQTGGRKNASKSMKKTDLVMLKSFGIHPWYADRYDPDNYMEAFRQCDWIGEIGMDSVWCEVDAAIQQKHLERQLQIAADLKKPVLLHTKGQEKKIAEVIRDFPYPICVHWYSGSMRELDAYLEQDCYFTLGPDLKMDPVTADQDGYQTAEEKAQKRLIYERMIREIPVTRLFLETDGISAVSWAMERKQLPLAEILNVLERNLRYLAEKTGQSAEALRGQMFRNLYEFLNHSFL